MSAARQQERLVAVLSAFFGVLALGVITAAVVTRYIEALLFGVTPLDPVTFMAALLLLVVVAALATIVPARRAATVDPMLVLRSE